jgi:hypothetical protein
MNMECSYLFDMLISFLLDVYLVMGLLDHMVLELYIFFVLLFSIDS